VAVAVDVVLAGTMDPAQAFVAWANACGWSVAFVCFFGLALVFPRGSLPSGRGRWPARVALLSLVVLALVIWFGPLLSVTLSPSGVSVMAPNPIGLFPGSPIWAWYPGSDWIYMLMFGFVVASIIALLGRYRHSLGQERLQYRWFVTAIVLVATTNLVWVVTSFGLAMSQYGLTWVAVVVAYATVPVAVAVAIQRYRLYEIDRVISRTIAYACVSVILAGVFGACVLILSSVLSSFANGESLAVAGSTLAACVALQPVLGRVRRGVDRWFDRAGYDTERTLMAFRDRVRSETDIEAVTTDLAATARSAVVPASMSLWLRPRRAGR
jgi:hypothetical protein